MMIYKSIDFQWPNAVQSLFNVSGSASSLSVFSSWNFVGGFKCMIYFKSLPIAANELLLTVYELIAGIVLMSVFWFSLAAIKRKGKTFIEKLKEEENNHLSVLHCMIVTLITMIYMMYSNFNK